MAFDPQTDILSLRNETGFLSPRQFSYVEQKRAEIVNPQLELSIKLQQAEREDRRADLAYQQSMLQFDQTKKELAEREEADTRLNDVIKQIPDFMNDDSPEDAQAAFVQTVINDPSVMKSSFFPAISEMLSNSLRAKATQRRQEKEDRRREEIFEREETRYQETKKSREESDRIRFLSNVASSLRNPETLQSFNEAVLRNAPSEELVQIIGEASVAQAEEQREEDKARRESYAQREAFKADEQVYDNIAEIMKQAAKTVEDIQEQLDAVPDTRGARRDGAGSSKVKAAQRERANLVRKQRDAYFALNGLMLPNGDTIKVDQRDSPQDQKASILRQINEARVSGKTSPAQQEQLNKLNNLSQG